MTLVSRLTNVNDRMQAIADRLGVPQYGNVVMVIGNTQTLLTPRPKVMSMTSSDVVRFLSNNVEINQDDRWLEGISRNYTEAQLMQAKFIINAVQNNLGVWVGINTETKFIDKNRLLDWKVLVGVFRRR